MSKILKMLCLDDDYTLSNLAYPLTIIGKTKRYLKDYTIYGNTEGGNDVGDISEGKYIIPITAKGKSVIKLKNMSTTTGRITASKSSYGTSLNSTDITSGVIEVTQADYSNSTTTSYENGYICIFTEGLESGTYVLSCNIEVKSNPLNAAYMQVRPNNSTPTASLMLPSSGRASVQFQYTAGASEFIAIRICGVSFNISDIMISRSDIEDITYEPYIQPVTTNIYLDTALGDGERINYKDNVLPPLIQFKGTTIYEADTLVKPKGIQVKHY